MKSIKLYTGLFLLLNFTLFYITPVMFSFPSSMFPLFYFLARFILLLISMALLLNMFVFFIRDNVDKNKIKSSLFSTGFVFLFLFYLLEIFFTFYPETNGVNDTYCSKTWKYYYWRMNKQGFRDIDFTSMDNNGKQAVVFTGDSYTEGHGIKRNKDRVSDIIREKFPEYNIYNLGKCGFDIFDQIKQIENLPIVTDVIVLQICANDWDYLTAPQTKTEIITDKIELTKISGLSLSKYSVTFNYLKSKMNNILDKFDKDKFTVSQRDSLYTSFKVEKSDRVNSFNDLEVFSCCARYSTLPEDTVQYRLMNLFSPYGGSLNVMMDTVLFEDYLSKLDRINLYCKNRSIKFLVIPYPEFDEFSMKITAKYINRYLCKEIRKHNIACMDIYPALQRANLKTYTANRSDNHINSKASKVVADTLSVYLKNYIGKNP